MKFTGLFLFILLFSSIFTISMSLLYFEEVDAKKASGVAASRYGSDTKKIVCGDRLCEYTNQTSQDDPDVSKEQQEKDPQKLAEEREKAIREQLKITIKTPEVIEDETTESGETYNNFTSTESNELNDITESEVLANQTTIEIDLTRLLPLVNVPATLPLHEGYFNGELTYYIVTDSSDKKHSELITENQGWKVEYSPILENAPLESLSTTYVFSNGVKGNGVLNFQGEVFSSSPETLENYSPLINYIQVRWNEDELPIILVSEKQILAAVKVNKITLTELPIVLNLPQIVWPGGQIPVKVDKNVTDSDPFVGGQVIDIDLSNKTVTFVAHRSWGQDGRTIYQIITDSTPDQPAMAFGVAYSPKLANLFESSASTDLFLFKNGIKGSGPLGFQPNISGSVPSADNYSPICKIHIISWEDSENARLLLKISDIEYYENKEVLKIDIARPQDKDHLVNCPIIDPFQME